MYCRNCGQQMRDDEKFCSHCGAEAARETGTKKKKSFKFLAGIAVFAILGMIGYSATAHYLEKKEEKPIVKEQVVEKEEDIVGEVNSLQDLQAQLDMELLMKQVRPLCAISEYQNVEELSDEDIEVLLMQLFTDPYIYMDLHEEYPDYENESIMKEEDLQFIDYGEGKTGELICPEEPVEEYWEIVNFPGSPKDYIDTSMVRVEDGMYHAKLTGLGDTGTYTYEWVDTEIDEEQQMLFVNYIEHHVYVDIEEDINKTVAIRLSDTACGYEIVGNYGSDNIVSEETSEEIDYKKLYGPILNEYRGKDMYQQCFSDYSLYDIDGDGIKEFICPDGTGMADGKQSVYSIRNGKAVYLGAGMCRVGYLYKPNSNEKCIYNWSAHMEYEMFVKMSIVDDQIVSEMVYEAECPAELYQKSEIFYELLGDQIPYYTYDEIGPLD